MPKFLNKKEQVFDFKLTSYGKHLLSNGNLKPTYYAFFDDNIIYDISYLGSVDGTARSSSVDGITTARMSETQNNIQHRIRNETQYIGTQVLFEDVEKQPDISNLVEDSGYNYAASTSTYDDRQITFLNTKTPIENTTRKDVFKFEQMIGDAYLEGNTQHAPAWKLVTLQGDITGSSHKDNTTLSSSLEIPQIEIELQYNLKASSTDNLQHSRANLLDSNAQIQGTLLFDGGQYITLERDDLLVYTEELNTILLNKNFDIEVFEVTGSQPELDDILIRKDFIRDLRALNGDNITEEYINNLELPYTEPNTNNVEYYFDIYRDHEIDPTIVCKGVEIFNKDSYYIDIDLNCSDIEEDIAFYDIYGPVTEPEICQ